MRSNSHEIKQDTSSPIPGPAGGSEDRRLPLETGGIDFARALDSLLFEPLFMLFHDVVCEYDDPVAFLRRELANYI
jgi:hypothetical protein